jgi:amino acid adenylation domain-containing protein
VAAAHRIVVGGEQLTSATLREWAKLLPNARFVNEYGPTETVVGCSVHEVGALEIAALSGSAVPIGCPIRNTRLYVLDSGGRLQPVGVPGELWIGGAGVARGYLNRPELTAERFVSDRFASRPGARMYRTGDVCRWLPDGTLAYLGRNDDQVKIRGYRIELGEVESRLSQLPGVRESVVQAQEEGTGQKRLVAYVVLDGTTVTAVREGLGRVLPGYMVPTAYVELAGLPLTPNGKVDRRSLPAPGAVMRDAYVAPRTEVERRLSEIWSQVLRVGRVGAEDHFFELGGHSLLATRVASEIGKAFGKPVTLRALFDHPRLCDLASHVQGLLYVGHTAIPVVSREDGLPLSFAQHRLWFLDRLEGGSAQYNVPVALRLRGALNEEALQSALDGIVERHEVLRTAYAEVDDEAVQVVHPAARVPIVRIDLGAGAEATREARLRSLIGAEASTVFDLSRSCPLRCTLVLLGEAEYALLFTMHHIASDAWSMGVLVNEFVALYTARAQGVAVDLPVLPVQYADYAVWQRRRLVGDALEAQLDYWRVQLSGLPTVHALPLDHPRPAEQRFEGGRVERQLGVEVLSGVQALARSQDASVFMVLQSAFAVLLSRWSGETDIVIGTPVAGRLHPDLSGLIGFFVNTLVLRTDVSGDPTFEALVVRVRDTTLSAYEHQEVPFELLVEELKPARSLSHTPLFQVVLTLQNNEQSELVLPGLSIERMATEDQQVKFDIQLSVLESERGLSLLWTYSKHLFEGSSIERMADEFGRCLTGLVAQPQTILSDVDWLSPEATALLRVLGSGPVDMHRRDRMLPEQIAEQAQRTPEAVAVRYAEQTLAHAALDVRSNRLAHALLEQGLGRGTRVGLYLERSLGLLVALLGVMKAGAAYVVLDPQQPAERLRRILQDTGIQCVVTPTQMSFDESFETGFALVLGEVDAADWLSEYPDSAPEVEIAAADSAYVLYTSGSTGEPKGVEVMHGGLMDYCAFALEGYYRPGLTGSLVATSPGFDLTLPALYLPLLSGGCVEYVTEEDTMSGWLSRLSMSPGSLMRLTPSHVSGLLLEEAAPSLGEHVFVVGGEVFPVSLARDLQSRYPRSRIYNQYGPTETVVGCVWYDVTAQLSTLEDAMPVGRPMSNTVLYVVDAVGRLQPRGVWGELWIACAGVARGYLNRPELTAEKFISDPFSGDGRIYRSGDRARWRSDGHLELQGRLDDQVKVRGYRIELGDVESALRGVAGVREAAVAVHGEGVSAQLVGYVVGDASEEELRRRVVQVLPEYMHPAFYVALEHLPLTVNGKLDRRSLPAPEQLIREHVEPATETEVSLSGIWCEVLGLERVSVDAGFFELGGHSLLAMRLIGAVRQRLGVEVPIRLLFGRSDIRSVAAMIDGHEVIRRNMVLMQEKTEQVEMEW